MQMLMGARHRWLSVVSSSIGNVIEWYEYALYAYFATIISQLFFPAHDATVGVMLTFSTFAAGLAARPIGGIIFGYIGDRFSRKKMLMFTMLLMAIPTLCIGLLPTYASWGVAAPVCLVFLRVLQGIALGGEFGASCVYLFEAVPFGRRGFFGCMALTGVGLGLVLSACTILIVESLLDKHALYAYGWRIPFFVSVIGSLLALYMRRNLEESQDFVVARQHQQLVKHPLIILFRHYKRTMLHLFGIFLTTQTAFFIVFIFSKTMMIDFLHYNTYRAGIFNLASMVSYTLATLVFGYFSDRINKYWLIIIGTTGILLMVYPFIVALQLGYAMMILGIALLLGVFIGITEGILNPIVAESFPVPIRATSVAFCWNMTSILFGGTAPIIAVWLIGHAGGVKAVAWYMIITCMITLVVVGKMLRRNKEYAPALLSPDISS